MTVPENTPLGRLAPLATDAMAANKSNRVFNLRGGGEGIFIVVFFRATSSTLNECWVSQLCEDYGRCGWTGELVQKLLSLVLIGVGVTSSDYCTLYLPLKYLEVLLVVLYFHDCLGTFINIHQACVLFLSSSGNSSTTTYAIVTYKIPFCASIA